MCPPPSCPQEKHIQQFVNRGITEEMIRQIDFDHGGSIERDEFMKFMLIKMGLVEKETLDRIENLFAVFDEDGSGTLGVHDIRLRKKRLRDLVSVCFACASKSKNTCRCRECVARSRDVALCVGSH